MRCKPSGPVSAEVLIVGEAPGESEERAGVPFVGASGAELRRMLAKAGFDPNALRYTNVFMTRPPGNKIEAFCGKKAVVGKDYPLPPLSQGNYFLPEHLHELDRLKAEIIETQPKLIIAVGNTPCWALLKRTGIGKLRGSVYPNELIPNGPEVFPTYHPAAVLRDWSLRTVVIADLMKAKRAVTEGLSRPVRELWLEPSFEEFKQFAEDYIFNGNCHLLSFDIETAGGGVTCIGFAPSRERAITVPFYDPLKIDHNYWPTPELEKRAYLLVKAILESDIPKLGQNGLYDIQYCYAWKIKVRNYLHDTMIRHHALYSELEKGLGFLASIYTDEAPWKVLRDRNKDNFKADDE